MCLQGLFSNESNHKAIGNVKTHHTNVGKLPYYFDANGHQNYKNQELMMSYHKRKDGAWIRQKNGVYE